MGISEFDKVDACVNCKIREFCSQYPDDQYTCEEIMEMAGVFDYERASDMRTYCECYEPSYCKHCGKKVLNP